MSPDRLVASLASKGVELEPKLRYRAPGPLSEDALESLHVNKQDLLRHMILRESIPRLPWQLEGLLRAASDNQLRIQIQGVPDPGRYVVAWGCAYLLGDREQALERLWRVYREWSQSEGVSDEHSYAR